MNTPSTDVNGHSPVALIKTDKILRWVLLSLILLGIGLAFRYRQHFDLLAMQQWIDDAGLLGPLLFMSVYAMATVFFLPGSVLTLAGGAIFGPAMGTIYNLTGATIGATLAFLIARYLASDWVEQKTGGRLKQLKQGVETEAWRFVAFTRLVPLFPFNLLNYALGLTRIKLRHYIIATYICMLPGALAYTYLGYAGREAFTGSEGLIQKGLLALALLAVIAFLPRFIKKIRNPDSEIPFITVAQLKHQLEQTQKPVLLDVRTTEEFNAAHIPDAVNIPVESVFQHLEQLSTERDQAICIICRTDKRSIKTVHLLAQKGFTRIGVVKGGMEDWIQAGNKVQQL